MTEVMELAGKELKTSVVNHIGVFDNAFVCFFSGQIFETVSRHGTMGHEL